MPHFIIAPSLLSADFARLGEEATAVLNAGGDALHLDVMDNQYVPNLTVGPQVCQALRNYGIKAPIEVHLMTSEVDRLIEEFQLAGATSIVFHPDSSKHVHRSLQLIRRVGCKAGLAINPAISLQCLDYIWDSVDTILIMTVNPGFSGQAFIPSILEKIRECKRLLKNYPDIVLSVDGGVNAKNIRTIAEAGATHFVAGSAIFKQKSYAEAIAGMRAALANQGN